MIDKKKIKNFIMLNKVNDEQIEKIYDITIKGLLINSIVFILIGYTFHKMINDIALYSFLVAFLILLVSRYAILYKFRFWKKRKWLFYNTIGLFLTSLIWGSAIFIILSNSSIPEKNKIILFTVVAVMGATAISTIGTIIQLYIIFIVPIFVPIIFHFIYDRKENFLIYAFLTFVALIYYIKNAFMFSNSFSEIILKNRDILNQKDENLKKTQEILKQKDENLKKTEEILQQRELLQQQSKMAMMGEMIGSIAHQWRQPLNELTISIQMLEYTPNEKMLEEEFISNFIRKNKNTIDFMSETIDDFRNFFKVDKERGVFQVKDTIESTISILNAQLNNYGINLKVLGEDFEINSFKGEFQQVILNIINNAKDALIENNIKEKEIEIILKEKKLNKHKSSNSQKLIKKVIIIKDNAGGIPENIIDRIFEPYFTTKEQGKGTGIGLYISKMIIENNMNGTLSVKNIDSGAQFTIEFV